MPRANTLVCTGLTSLIACQLALCGEEQSSKNHSIATSSAELSSPLPTREQAIAALQKIRGQIIFDDTKPGRPLTRIWLTGTLINNSSLQYLSAFPDLPWLQIHNVEKVTDAGLVHLEGLKNLRNLSLEGSSVTDAGLVYLKGLSNLESLNLINSRVTGSGLSNLNELKQLKTLRLSFSELDDSAVEHLINCRSLQVLELDDTRVTDSGVEKVRRALPQCHVLWSPLGVAAVRSTVGSTPALSSQPAEVTSSKPGEWPQWRGPSRDGICRETGLIQELPSEGPPLMWECRRVGWGYSAVAVADSRLVTTGKMSHDKPTQLLAYSTENGTPLWKCDLVVGDDDPFSTPTIDRDLVFALSREGELICAKAADGTVVWRRNFMKDFGGTYQSFKKGGGYSESILVDGDHIICTPGGPRAFIVALHRHSGELVWTTPLPTDFGPQGIDAAGFASPVVSSACGIRQYVQMTGRGLISVAADDGRTLWTYNKIANVYNNVATPIVRGDYVFASTAHGDTDSGTALIKIVSAHEKLRAEQVYRLPERTAANHHGGMILAGEYIYMGHGYNRGFPLCLEMMTGKIMWRPGRGPGTGSAAVICADGQIYFSYENGVVLMVEATPNAYTPKGHFQSLPNERSERAHPVIAGGRLYLRGGNWLRCYDVTRK